MLEQLHVRVAEPVDRLLGVAHRESVLVRDRRYQLELYRVCVLELVDHDPREPLRVVRTELSVAQQQVARDQLEVREVKAGSGPLSLRVASAVVA